MRLRSQRAHPTASIDDEGPQEDELTLAEKIADRAPNPEEIYARKELNEIFERKLEGLSPSLRSALLLRDVQGLSTEEAARALGVPEGTLKSQLHRARAQLATLLRDALGSNSEDSARPFMAGSRVALCRATG